jgi:hypothetical protein
MSNLSTAESPEKELKRVEEEPVGAFYATLRRPKTQKDGLVALFFGENGRDADTISALHATQFLDLMFKVKVWRVRDANGASQIGLNLDGKHSESPNDPPLLTKFVGKNRRPAPSIYGQTAQFFGQNGRHADAIAVLTQSAYQDNVVYIEIYHHQESDTVDISEIADKPFDTVESTSEPKSKIEKEKAKASGERDLAYFNQLLNSNFFTNPAILKHLGSPRGYRAWLTHQACVYPFSQKEEHDKKVNAFELKDFIDITLIPQEFLSLPICEKHIEDFKNILTHDDNEKYEYVRRFAIMEAKRQLEEFAKMRFMEQLEVPKNHIPRRDVIDAWALKNDVLHLSSIKK